jgi:hypothetical protein
VDDLPEKPKSVTLVAPHWPALLAAPLILLAGPTVMWGLLPRGLFTGVCGVIAFASGWVLLGAGIRPGSSGTWGAIFAAGLYCYVGLVWAFRFNMSLGATPEQLLHPGMLLIALIWPLQVAQKWGLFGLAFG